MDFEKKKSPPPKIVYFCEPNVNILWSKMYIFVYLFWSIKSRLNKIV